MARLLTAGAETLSAIGEDKTMEDGIAAVGAVTIDSVTFNGGAKSFKCDTGAGNVAANVGKTLTAVDGVSYFMREYVLFPSLITPGARSGLLKIYNSAAEAEALAACLKTDGTIQLHSGGAPLGTAFTPSANVWHRLEILITLNVAGNDAIEFRVDGSTLHSGSQNVLGVTTLGVKWGWSGTLFPNANSVMHVDDLALNDSTGAAQASWPGAGKVVLLRPISDNARDTLWTGGSGGTTNLFDAVDNVPPAGTATESNTTQIEHAGGAAGTTDRYDANMTTPASAGIAPADTVNLAYFLEVDGEDVSTGAKLLNFEVLSNPVIASPGDVTAGNGSALGTYPTNWVIRKSAITYNPSVTVGTSPVMRARRPETASRVASVCFMGIIMDYTPAVAVSSPPDRDRRRRSMQRTRV